MFECLQFAHLTFGIKSQNFLVQVNEKYLEQLNVGIPPGKVGDSSLTHQVGLYVTLWYIM